MNVAKNTMASGIRRTEDTEAFGPGIMVQRRSLALAKRAAGQACLGQRDWLFTTAAGAKLLFQYVQTVTSGGASFNQLLSLKGILDGTRLIMIVPVLCSVAESQAIVTRTIGLLGPRNLAALCSFSNPFDLIYSRIKDSLLHLGLSSLRGILTAAYRPNFNQL